MSGGVPPSSRAGRFQRGRSRAASLYERFTGHDAEVIGEVRLPKAPREVAVIGQCTAICYSTVRDGRREEYIHEFRKVDRPHLCVDPSGRQLLLIGGNYDFTELGIVDASDAKHSPRRRRR